MDQKTMGQELLEKLANKPVNLFDTMSDKEIEDAYAFGEYYKKFLDKGKTERECIDEAVLLAKEKGFTYFDRNKKYGPNDKVYIINNNKALYLFVFGEKTVDEGIRMIGAHVDSPRLDLKPNPLFEDKELCLMKTHYYGGIKKYQWTTIPLALHGVVCKTDGTTINVKIGEEENEPVLVLTDLLPHLATEQVAQKMSEAIKGENMSVLVGSRPFKDDKASDKVKLNILSILNKKYGITEKDFLTAELEIVPATKARDVGLDGSLIGGYGHDDRVCSYAGLAAILNADNPTFSILCGLVDKEETGSDGLTGMKSKTLQYFLEEIAEMQGVSFRDMYRNSLCLSADVTAAFDPVYPDVMDAKNSAFLNHGVCLSKYHGSRGKYGTSDASAELLSQVISIIESVTPWQTGEMGKVDAGGGGTISKFVAELGVPTVDVGVAMLSMHAPWEIISKLDLYSTYKAFTAFFK